ncbi:MAG: hypothetical protein ABWZ54_06070 [Luteibacter sp.]
MIDLQAARQANLITVLRELETDGVVGLGLKAEVLGTTDRVLEAILEGRAMPDELAREIEWAAQKPAGWMDEDHRFGPPL